MLDFLIIVLFCWLLFKAVGLAFRAAWGAAKLAASLLFVIAVPLLILCAIFVGGLVLLVPLALVGIAFVLLKAIA